MLFICITLTLTILFLIIVFKPARYEIFGDGIVIKDMYGARIPNTTIVSIRMLDKLPKFGVRSNGINGIRELKGYFYVKTERSGRFGERALLQLKRKKAPFIEIVTTNGLILINLNSEEQTQALFEEMVHDVKLLRADQLDPPTNKFNNPNFIRSLVLVVAFVVIIIGIALSQVIRSARAEVQVHDDMIETFGNYSEKIPFDEIVSVRLTDTLPDISLRTNGYASGKKMVGYFRLTDKTKCSLFIQNKEQVPFIEIKTNEDLYYINDENSSKTEQLFQKIKY